MKKFSRCVLILILAIVLGGVGGYIYGVNVLQPAYTSVAELYVIPKSGCEAMLRAKDGSLNADFAEVITNSVVIGPAKKKVGTSESITKYIDVVTVKNSNVVQICCTNPDAGTAKEYVDAVAESASTNIGKIIPVDDVHILTYGSVQSEPERPQLIYYVIGIAAVAGIACLFLEVIVVLCMCAFKKSEEVDDELEYERNYGKYAVINRDDIMVLKEAMSEVAAAKVAPVQSAKEDNDEAKKEPVPKKSKESSKENVTDDGDHTYYDEKPDEDEDLDEAKQDPEESKEELTKEPESEDGIAIIGRIKK